MILNRVAGYQISGWLVAEEDRRAIHERSRNGPTRLLSVRLKVARVMPRKRAVRPTRARASWRASIGHACRCAC